MKYIIYARKSTENDDRQVLSIESQLAELREFAAKEKLEIVASFQEAKTAKEPGRMKFAEMLQKIEKGEAEGILSWHPDRLARNSVDGGKIIHMIDRGLIKSLKFPTFWFEPTPHGLFMLNIAFGQSKYFVDNLRENTKRGLRQKIRIGVWPGWAPVGYLNNLKTKMIDVDSEKALKIRKLFKLYATGKHTLNSLANWCREHNLKGNLGKNISTSNISVILQNVFYIGLMKYKGEIFEGVHKPLVSKKLFDRVQEILKQRGRTQEVKKHDFVFLGLMKCASCGASITAEIQKGHNYYRCTKKKGICQEKHYLREENLIEQIKNFLQKVSLSSQDIKKVLAELEKDELQAKEQAKDTVQNLKVELLQIDKKLEKLMDAYLNEVISTEEYTSRKQKILTRKLELQEKIRDFEQKGLSWLEPAREFVLKLNYAEKLLNSENYQEMTTFLKNIGSNHILRNSRLIFSPKIPFNLVAERSEATHESLTFPYWLPIRDSNCGLIIAYRGLFLTEQMVKLDAMKIAVFHNLPSGGAKRALFEFVKRLRENHDLDVFDLSCSNKDFFDLRSLVKNTYTFKYEVGKSFLKFNYNLLTKLPKVNKEIAEKINKGKYDLAFVNGCFLTQAPYILRYLTIPSVYFCQEPRREFYENIWFHPPRLKNFILHYIRIPLKWIDQRNARSANLILANSLYTKKNIEEIYRVKTELNRLGVNSDDFKWKKRKRGRIVLSVGAFSYDKAHDFVIRSLSLLPIKKRPPLVIVGNGGVAKQFLQDLAAKLSVELTILEYISEKELIDWYNRAGVLVHSSITGPFSLTPLEAMACGLLVVAVNDGGYAETIIDGETGFLTKRDPFVFAKKIEMVLDNKLTEKRSKMLREYVMNNWTWENSVRNLEKNFQMVLKK